MKQKAITFALSGLLLLSAGAYATGGSYSSTISAPTVTLKNQWYQKAFPVTSGTPSAGKIGMVYYNWAYGRDQAGLRVSLCTSTSTVCINVTNAKSGSVNFSSYNLSPNQALSLKAIVEGTGKMVPLYGNQSQVIVNYSFN